VALLFGLLILALMSIPLVISLRRAGELFCVTVRDGKVTFRRGRLPQRLLDDICDVVSRPQVKRATIRVVREAARPRAIITGDVSPATRQRLRNVVGTFSTAKLEAGGRPSRPKRRRGPSGRR
jgi:hypothetical protein